jgi:hypothetical protein
MDRNSVCDSQALRNNTVFDAETVSRHVHHDRAWWRVEARRLGSDWCEILRLYVEVVAAWRTRHDQDYGRAAA